MYNVDRRCTGCYAKEMAQQSTVASNTTTKKVKASDYDQVFRLQCFNDNHYGIE